MVDWDDLAVDGIHQIADAPDCSALRARLTRIFAVVAPTAHIGAAGEVFEAESLRGESVRNLDVVSWEHRGYGDSTIIDSGYASKRRHRPRVGAVAGAPFMSLSQSIDATAYRGMPVRLKGKLRAAGHGKARIWLRVDHGAAPVFFENMINRPVMSSAWTNAEVEGSISSDASQIVFGVLMLGGGTTWYDALELSVKSPEGIWQHVDISDGDFESPTLLEHWQAGIGKPASMDGWIATIDHDRPASGASSLRVEEAKETVTEELFTEGPSPGESAQVELGCGLRARVPIALYSRSGHTVGDDPERVRSGLATVGASVPPSGGFDALTGVADVVVVWNVLQHFWPYQSLIAIDWNSKLDAALAGALADHDVDDHVMTLQRLSAGVPDGHASTTCPGMRKLASPPFVLDEVEGQLVVTSSAAKALEPGDIVFAVDGVQSMQLLAREEALISGSPQWRRAKALQQLGYGPIGSSMRVSFRRGATDLGVSVERVVRRPVRQALHAAIERFDDGYYYVDLSRASMAEIEKVIDDIAVSPGVVFDLRGRPNSNHQIISHLLTVRDTTTWMAIPHIVRPGSAGSPAAWQRSGWDLPVASPHINGRVAFVTGPRAISYSESVMGLVEYYHLGAIIGEATAGTNGDIAQISSPTGCDTIFTGRLVTKPDGSRHYLQGISPTIPATRTVAGVAAGRDEVLERALAYVRGASH